METLGAVSTEVTLPTVTVWPTGQVVTVVETTTVTLLSGTRVDELEMGDAVVEGPETLRADDVEAELETQEIDPVYEPVTAPAVEDDADAVHLVHTVDVSVMKIVETLGKSRVDVPPSAFVTV